MKNKVNITKTCRLAPVQQTINILDTLKQTAIQKIIIEFHKNFKHSVILERNSFTPIDICINGNPAAPYTVRNQETYPGTDKGSDHIQRNDQITIKNYIKSIMPIVYHYYRDWD